MLYSLVMTSPRTRALVRAMLAVPVGLGLTALVAPPAHAAGPTLSNSGGILRISATSALDLYVTTTWTAGEIQVSNSTGAFGSATGTCTQGYNASSYVCTGVNKIVVVGSTAADEVLALSSPVPMEVRGGAGDDDIATGDSDDLVFGDAGEDVIGAYGGNDTVDGGAGDDWQIRGDAGNDTVRGGSGNDHVMGNEGDDDVSGGDGHDDVDGDSGSNYWYDTDGNDTLRGDGGNDELGPQGGTDVVHGGTGIDTVSYENFSEDGEIFKIALDNLANDGPSGQKDNVGPAGDVENAVAPWLTDFSSLTMLGNAAANRLEVSFAGGPVVIDGGAGNDVIWSDGSDGTTTVRGGDGDDQINGSSTNEKLYGGPGGDEIHGGGGNDVIDGQAGPDQVFGEGGNDNIQAVDNEVDTISCGEDADIARVDTGDVVAFDGVSICESLTKVQPAKPNVTVPTTAEYRLNANGVATFSLTNNSAFSVLVEATANTTTPVGSGRVTLAARTAGKLYLRLTPEALAVVERRGSMRASVTFVSTGNGQTTQVKRVVTFLKN